MRDSSWPSISYRMRIVPWLCRSAQFLCGNPLWLFLTVLKSYIHREFHHAADYKEFINTLTDIVSLFFDCYIYSIFDSFHYFAVPLFICLTSFVIHTASLVVIAPRGALQPSMGEILSRDVTWCNVTNMSAKNNSESEYYGGDLVMWCRQKIIVKVIVKVNIMGEILSRE